MVEALETDSKAVLDKGTLQVIDNQVDQTTGTIRLKADFPNKELQLWPGQFVNVRLLLKTLDERRRGPDRRRSSAAPTAPSSTSSATTTRSRCAPSPSPSRTTPRPWSPRA